MRENQKTDQSNGPQPDHAHDTASLDLLLLQLDDRLASHRGMRKRGTFRQPGAGQQGTCVIVR
jgi:hypothetical protein